MSLSKRESQNILIIGMAGGLAQITAGLLIKAFPKIHITGVDPRPMTESIKNKNIEYIQMSYTRSHFEKLFRDKKFDLVFHLARLGRSNANPGENLAQRLDLNLMETKRIMDLSLKFGVKKVIILSTYHVYGALPDNPVFITEDQPLKASIKYPELRDVVEMDQIATNWMWKNQKYIETIVFRPCTILGPQIQNTMTRYIMTNYVPICMDFNPMFQFIHEYDMANILVRSLTELPVGIYNVATDEVISIKTAKKLIRSKTISVPSLTLHTAAKLINIPFWSFPEYLIDYIQYPSIISNTLLKKHLGQNLFRYTTRETLELTKLS